jgi:hypothetical protein
VLQGVLLRRYSEFLREGNFPESKGLVLLRQYSKYAEHLRKPLFLLQRYSIHAEHHVGVLLCGKSPS